MPWMVKGGNTPFWTCPVTNALENHGSPADGPDKGAD
jgi:hypothetical protein